MLGLHIERIVGNFSTNDKLKKIMKEILLIYFEFFDNNNDNANISTG